MYILLVPRISSYYVCENVFVCSSILAKPLREITSKFVQYPIMSLQRFSYQYYHEPTLLLIAINRIRLG